MMFILKETIKFDLITHITVCLLLTIKDFTPNHLIEAKVVKQIFAQIFAYLLRLELISNFLT